jgi:opacity protein-like surface antigen
MTHDIRISPLLIGLLILLLVAPLDVSAEFYADVYSGAVFTNKTDLTITSSLGPTVKYQNLKVNDTWTAGGRAGYWFDGLDWLGLGLDVFYFQVKAPSQVVPSTVTGLGPTTTTLAPADYSLPVMGIGFDVLRLRAPLLRSEEFPHGRLQPHLSAGPALFVTRAGTARNVQPQSQRDTDIAVGAKAEGGVTFLLTKTVGLFTEYRFTHFTSKLSYQNTTLGLATDTFKTTWDSHQIIGGISVRFP